MKRRIFAAALAAALVLSLAACGGGNGGGTSTSNPGSSSTSSSGSSQPGGSSGPDISVSLPDASLPDASSPDGSQSEESPEVTITLNQTKVKLTKAGATFQLKAQTSPEGGKVTFTSSDEKIITVNSEGVITAVAPGKAGVSVQCDGASQVIVSVECDWKEETKPETKPEQKPDSKPDGSGSSSSGGSSSSSSSSKVDLSDFYSTITGKYQFSFMMEADADMLSTFFAGLSNLKLSQQIVSLCGMSPSPNGDFVLIQVSDSKDVDKVKSILQARIDYMVGDGNGPGGAFYPMEQTTWEEYARIAVNGDYVMLIAHENCDDIVNDFNALF